MRGVGTNTDNKSKCPWALLFDARLFFIVVWLDNIFNCAVLVCNKIPEESSFNYSCSFFTVLLRTFSFVSYKISDSESYHRNV